MSLEGMRIIPITIDSRPLRWLQREFSCSGDGSLADIFIAIFVRVSHENVESKMIAYLLEFVFCYRGRHPCAELQSGTML